MTYKITRGLQPSKPLTPAQRNSGLFAEEPVVLGKVLRARMGPMQISDAQYEANKARLGMLAKAGAIQIKKLGTETLVETQPAPVVETEPVAPPVTEATPEETLDMDKQLAEAPPAQEEQAPPVEEVQPEVRTTKKGKKG